LLTLPDALIVVPGRAVLTIIGQELLYQLKGTLGCIGTAFNLAAVATPDNLIKRFALDNNLYVLKETFDCGHGEGMDCQAPRWRASRQLSAK
jgi:hypothetical protein